MPRSVLLDPEVRVIASDGLAAGAIANRTGAVVGISNVFARDGVTAGTWMGATSVLDAAYTGMAIGGYCDDEGVSAAHDAGFEDLGALRAWLAP